MRHRLIYATETEKGNRVGRKVRLRKGRVEETPWKKFTSIPLQWVK